MPHRLLDYLRGQRIAATAPIHLETVGTSLLGRPLEVLPKEVASIVRTRRPCLPTLRLLCGRHCMWILSIAIRVHWKVTKQILEQYTRFGIALSFRWGFQFWAAECGRESNRKTKAINSRKIVQLRTLYSAHTYIHITRLKITNQVQPKNNKKV